MSARASTQAGKAILRRPGVSSAGRLRSQMNICLCQCWQQPIVDGIREQTRGRRARTLEVAPALGPPRTSAELRHVVNSWRGSPASRIFFCADRLETSELRYPNFLGRAWAWTASFAKMKLSNQSTVPVYTISGSNTARPLPEWLARRRKRSLKNDPEYANRVELLQDFEFEEASQCIRVSEDGQWVMSTGKDFILLHLCFSPSKSNLSQEPISRKFILTISPICPFRSPVILFH